MGLDRMAVAEVSVSGMPLETLEWLHEKFILDYFCKALLLLHQGLNSWPSLRRSMDTLTA